MNVCGKAVRDRRCGFTLVEMAITIAIIALVLVLAVPNFRLIVEHERLRDATQALQSDLMTARAEAIRRNIDIFAVFITDGGTGWCYGVAARSDCDCRIADVANATACALSNPDGSRQLKVVASNNFRDVRMTSAVFGGTLNFVGFNPFRGATTQGTGTPLSGSVELRSPDDSMVRVLVNPVGRASPCSTNLSGYRPCS